jgi:hypothetical protein
MGTGSGRYEIRIQGRLDPEWAEYFQGFQLLAGVEKETVLCGIVPDQAALHGLLARVRDLNLTLLSVKLVEKCCAERSQRRMHDAET